METEPQIPLGQNSRPPERDSTW